MVSGGYSVGINGFRSFAKKIGVAEADPLQDSVVGLVSRLVFTMVSMGDHQSPLPEFSIILFTFNIQ